ncbi:tRNA lysidine(34) synthetase TilS [Candidatus Shikimatogenerans bostrichidophilus]|uniref:tRNA lysidine(34) synthetase TilS n=1 Tax=Candidatus Shikimatogenerans bostrichidophilus TaxID=2943807 RepID=UPI0029668A9C
MLFKKIKHFILLNKLLKNKFLLAISGGVDSMVLLNIFNKIFNNNNISVAHCNFNINKSKINYNYNLIYKICYKNNINFFYKQFKTIKFSKIKKLSIQISARILRYKWFFNLKKKYNYDYIVLAHNLEDNIETFFINLFRKTGLYGLKSIKKFSKNLLRPLIKISKNEIINYAIKNKIKWINDISNLKNIYLRNIIRNNIIPNIFNNLYKYNIKNNINNTIINLQLEYNFIKKSINYFKKKIIIYDKNNYFIFKIKINKLLNLKINYYNYLLYKIFYKFGFNDIKIFNKILNINTGKFFLSNNKIYKIIKNKNEIILIYNVKKKINILIPKIGKYKIVNNLLINLKLIKFNNKIINNNKYICLNFNKIKFPLYIRNWINGDYYLNNKKKIVINKIFKKNKITSFEKNFIYLLLNNNKEIICTINKIKIINKNYLNYLNNLLIFNFNETK